MGRTALVSVNGTLGAVVNFDERVDALGVGAQLLETEWTDLVACVSGQNGQAL